MSKSNQSELDTLLEEIAADEVALTELLESDADDGMIDAAENALADKKRKAERLFKRLQGTKTREAREAAEKDEQHRKQQRAAYLKKQSAIVAECEAYDRWIEDGRKVIAAIEKANRAAENALPRDEVERVHTSVLTLPGDRPGVPPPFSNGWRTERGPGRGDVRQVLEHKGSLADYAKQLRDGAERRIELLNNPPEFDEEEAA
jgi:hypothetical protein